MSSLESDEIKWLQSGTTLWKVLLTQVKTQTSLTNQRNSQRKDGQDVQKQQNQTVRELGSSSNMWYARNQIIVCRDVGIKKSCNKYKKHRHIVKYYKTQVSDHANFFEEKENP